jgi:hypothetical protein
VRAAVSGPEHILKGATTLILGLLVIAARRGVLALYYSDLESAVLRATLAVLFGLFGLAVISGLAMRRWRRYALGSFVAVFAAVLACWSSIAPSNDRDWKPEVAVLPRVAIDGDLVTVHNIRNFDYRSETDFTLPTMTRPLIWKARNQIWSLTGRPDIAHIFLSFGLGPGSSGDLDRATDERGEVPPSRGSSSAEPLCGSG